MPRIRGERLEEVQGTVLQLQRNPNGDCSGRGDQRFERLIRIPGPRGTAQSRDHQAQQPLLDDPPNRQPAQLLACSGAWGQVYGRLFAPLFGDSAGQE